MIMEAHVLYIQTCAGNPFLWELVDHIPLSAVHTGHQQDCSKLTYPEGVLDLLTRLLGERGVYSGW